MDALPEDKQIEELDRQLEQEVEKVEAKVKHVDIRRWLAAICGTTPSTIMHKPLKIILNIVA